MQGNIKSVATSGNLNPMYGKRHSLETKQKISDSQKKRYAAIRKAIEEQNLLNYADTSSDARKDVILHLLDNNELNFKTVQQAINFLAIMLEEAQRELIIAETVDNYIAKNTRPYRGTDSRV